ncbi:MAG TPA: nuclear transport factor 2 family protein [Frankiaceae bacterium]|nr:nuclear transport factor 2 family protein [Frankiaceae bacterium]
MTVSPEDFIAICDLCYSYAAGVDGHDWTLLRSIFTDRVVFDFSSLTDRPAVELAADDWVAGIQPLFTGLAATQHSMTNPRIALDGESAGTGVLTMYMQAEHILDADDPTSYFTVGGYYTNRVRRTDGRWRIAEVKLTILWQRGRPDILG